MLQKLMLAEFRLVFYVTPTLKTRSA